MLIREARSYQYDALDRLSQESEGASISYGYDANGNRLTRTVGTQTTSYAYTPGSNQLASIDTTALVYDAAGNLITDDQGRSVTYNNTGRLAEVQQGATTLAAYSYNAQGQRTRKVSASGTVVYHYDLAGHLIAETTHTGLPLRDYVWQDAAPVAQLDAGGLIYLHTDHLNTPRLATNSAGIAVWRWEGEAFGNTPPNEDPDQDLTLTKVNLRFPGQYFDAETELNYNWNRYYDPRVGRYITSDPIGLDGGRNTYAYVASNPWRFVDDDGLFLRLPVPIEPIIGGPRPVPPPGVDPFPPGIPDPLAPTPRPEPPTGEPRGKGRYYCKIKCNVQEILASLSTTNCPNCPQFVFGLGYGQTANEAWNNAWDSANAAVPRGCYKRHCRGIEGSCKNWKGGKR